ncbi:hypothetical protein CARUB_v10010044mg [Capsella rubella]|uniref:Uncharacterized protein n=1 Tax=Capsella rubella TaxID=81985 RepID=R0I1R5_9BRAS|nr:uncharacterized protein LOC17897991 [Capsella rubella]EOA36179.1 hypothetical protein CARUB_v10010044mg [Capsella rubella]
MGILAFKWAAEGEGNNKLTLMMNRDNYVSRVISGASWNSHILSGRCEYNNGTWFAISKRGRVAFLMSVTLIVDDFEPDSGCELYPVKFLESNLSPQEFAEQMVQRDGTRQCGWSYSLIVADMNSNSMVHIRKPDKSQPNFMIQTVPFGVHTLSPFEGLDSMTEPKDVHLKHRFTQMISGLGNNPQPQLEAFARRSMCSPGEGTMFTDRMIIHAVSEGLHLHGTTSTTALLVKHSKEVIVFERFRNNNSVWNEHEFHFYHSE